MFITNRAELARLSDNEGKSLADLEEELEHICEALEVAEAMERRGKLPRAVEEERARLLSILRTKKAIISQITQG